MPTKLIMRWNVRPETESQYFEFLVHEFIPGLNSLGIGDIEVWYTAYGSCEQKLASGVAQSKELMTQAMHSREWKALMDKLDSFVNEFHHKVIPATRGFQV